MAVNEELKIEIRKHLERFARDSGQTEFEFRSDLSSQERAFVHRQCQILGLKSKSRGGGDNRYLTVTKERRPNVIGGSGDSSIPEVQCGDNVLNALNGYLITHPLTNVESRELQYQGVYRQPMEMIWTPSVAPNGPGIPPWPNLSTVSEHVKTVKRNLPVQDQRGEFVEKLHQSQVMLVVGETGSGKSTQIPQFILEDATHTSTPCRLIIAEPRRLAATTLADRLAQERGETVGDVVGYQIRLDSRMSQRTLATFCTNGVLLSEITSGPNFLNSVTHIVIDEVHERDKFSDFLLIILRERLPYYPHLKLILMSASLEKELLGRYFPHHSFLDVPGRTYSISSYYLGDVLSMTKYVHMMLSIHGKNRPKELTLPTVARMDSNIVQLTRSVLCSESEPRNNAVDSQLEAIWRSGMVTATRLFGSIMDQISTQGLDVNYRHMESNASLLMVAAGMGMSKEVNMLLEKGADASMKLCNGWQAIHWAVAFGNPACQMRLNDATPRQNLIEVYHSLVDDDQIDIGFVVELLVFINDFMPRGAVLVFLPGYEDILQVKEAMGSDKRLPYSKVFLCILHSQMRGHEQRRAFDPVPSGKRRIVLSTNLAEVSVTLEDICYVIDSGKMKQRGYDAVNDVNALSTNWISKTNVLQRAGRAGRCQDGICFHLYSTTRYAAMAEKAVPEILRVPIHELCLQTRLLNPDLNSVAEFLKMALEPPSDALVSSSIQLLKAIGAFDEEERLTILGRRLIDIPADPQLGKMVLYGVMMRCLDPVLTVVASLSYGDPFVLPRERDKADLATRRRYMLGRSTPFSDHGALLNAFYQWKQSRAAYHENGFIRDNFLSKAALEMIEGTKRLLLRTVRSLGFGAGLPDHEFDRVFNQYSNYWSVVTAALTAGTYPNIAMVDRSSGKFMTKSEMTFLNPSSVLLCSGDGKRMTRETRSEAFDSMPTDWIIFNDICRQNYNMQVKCATAVDSLTIALFAGPCHLSEANIRVGRIVNNAHEDWDAEDDGIEVHEISVLNIDTWLKVRMEKAAASRLLHIRQKLHASFLRQLCEPHSCLYDKDFDGTLASVVALLRQQR